METIFKKHPENRSIIKHGLPHFDMCTDLFGQRIARGKNARSSHQAVTDDEQDQDEALPNEVPPDIDTPSHSAYNFTPSSSYPDGSRLSGRKRTLAQQEEIMDAICIVASYSDLKKSKFTHDQEEFEKCLAIVQEMNLPLRLKVNAGEQMGLTSTRSMFLHANEVMHLEWSQSLGDM